MTDRPILFQAPMVRAILAGTKTQTRRILTIKGTQRFSAFGRSNTPGYFWHFRDEALRWHDLRHSELLPRLKFSVGDRLWVRETLKRDEDEAWRYAADRKPIVMKPDDPRVSQMIAWAHHKESSACVSIHMPRWASRLTLIVTDVRVQRLQDISEDDAVAEGCYKGKATGRVFNSMVEARITGGPEWRNARDWYADLWDSINDKIPWEANPWVAAYTFTTHHRNIDAMPAEGEGSSRTGGNVINRRQP